MVSFKENPQAFCLLAKSHTDPHEALRIFAEPVGDGTWTADPATYLHHLSWPQFWELATRPQALDVRRRLVGAILSRSLDDAAHAALLGVFRTLDLAPLDVAADLVTWLGEKAGPNDATMIAEIVEYLVFSRDRPLVGDCFPLVEWLLTKGSSELRSGRRSPLVAQLVPVVAQRGTAEQLASTVRYVLYNDHRVGDDGWGHQTVGKLLPAVERLLGRSEGEAIVGDVLEACTPPLLGDYFAQVLRGWADYPRTRTAMVKRLARGQMTSDGRPPAPETWVLVVGGPPVDVEIEDIEIARVAAEGLARHSQGARSGDEASAAWGYIIAREFLRTSDLLSERRPDDIRYLQQCAGFDIGVADGMCRAVREAVAKSSDPTLYAAREMLASPGVGSQVAVAALQLLVGSVAAAPVPVPGTPIDHVVEAIERALLAKVPPVSGFSFRETVGGAAHVRVEELPGEQAFHVAGDVLLVSRAALERLCRLSDDPTAQRALGVLYAVHEVVHQFQGVSGMGRVAQVRFAGAESALMHIDLGADHVAAMVANAALPKWDLLWLKDWQGKSIMGFPAGARNPPYSRIRKTLRLVGLRVDLALRKLGIGAEHFERESYGFADFSPSGGAFIAMVNRPPFVVVKTGEVSSSDASVLFEGIEGAAGSIERVDEVVQRALGGG